MDLMEKSKLFLLGLWDITEEKVTDFANDMVKKGKLTAEEAKKMVKEYTEKGRDKYGEFHANATGRLAKSLKEMGFVARDEYEELKKKITDLEKMIKNKSS